MELTFLDVWLVVSIVFKVSSGVSRWNSAVKFSMNHSSFFSKSLLTLFLCDSHSFFQCHESSATISCQSGFVSSPLNHNQVLKIVIYIFQFGIEGALFLIWFIQLLDPSHFSIFGCFIRNELWLQLHVVKDHYILRKGVNFCKGTKKIVS